MLASTQTMSRVYEWRCAIGTTGLQSAATFIQNVDNAKEIGKRGGLRAFLLNLIVSHQFLYEDPWSTKKKARCSVPP